MTAPVLLVFYSRTQMPESGQLADDMATLSGEFEGRFLAGLVDIDAVPAIAQAMQIPSVPLRRRRGRRPADAALPGRRPARGAARGPHPGDAAAHHPGHHRAPPAAQRRRLADAEDEEQPAVDPRYAPAQDALEAGDVDGAVARVPEARRRQPRRRRGRGRAGDGEGPAAHPGCRPPEARRGRGQHPDDVAAQTLVADLDLLGGHVEDAFTRLVDWSGVRPATSATPPASTCSACSRAVGNDDPRVLKGRQNLASALF